MPDLVLVSTSSPAQADTDVRATRAVALPGGPRLGPHELAYLRAIAQGLDALTAGRTYLGVGHGAELTTAHRFAVSRAAAIARRRGDPRWRLMGIAIPRSTSPEAAIPSVDAWAAAEGLEDWSWNELVAMHVERFGDALGGARERRVAMRNARLMERRLALLADLQLADPRPLATDSLDGWLEPTLAERLKARGLLTLGELRARIDRGGRWWASLTGYGPVKARRLAAHVDALLGPRPAVATGWHAGRAAAALDVLERRPGANRAPASAAGTRADTDRRALESWIVPTARSFATAASYQREGERFLLWAALERGLDLAGVTAEDCSAYIDFLGRIPASWCSRSQAPRLGAGWAPFRGELSPASRQLAITIVRGWFSWLVRAGYLQRNPWTLVDCRVGDDPFVSLDPTTRAFTPAAWDALEEQLDDDERAGRPESARRLRWILAFCRATGVRASELILARRGQLRRSSGIWVLQVFGKGRKAREVVVTKAALEATRKYLRARGIDFETCPPETPLLGALATPGEGRLSQRKSASTSAGVHVPEPSRPRGAVGYSAIRKAMKRLVERAARRVDDEEGRAMVRASLHWLRHTFATRAAEAGVLPNDIQEQLGQADPRTAARYSRAQIQNRAAALERAATASASGVPPLGSAAS